MKSQLRQRAEGGWKRVHWEMVERPTLRQLQLLRARIGVMNQHVRPPNHAHTHPEHSSRLNLSSAPARLGACDQRSSAYWSG